MAHFILRGYLCNSGSGHGFTGWIGGKRLKTEEEERRNQFCIVNGWEMSWYLMSEECRNGNGIIDHEEIDARRQQTSSHSIISYCLRNQGPSLSPLRPLLLFHCFLAHGSSVLLVPGVSFNSFHLPSTKFVNPCHLLLNFFELIQHLTIAFLLMQT